MITSTFTRITSCLCIVAFVSSGNKPVEKVDDIAPPPQKKTFEITSNGHTRIDNYFWMRLSDEQKNAEQKDEQTTKVLAYLTTQNDYLKARAKHTEALQKKLYNEMVGGIKQTDESVPYKSNGYWYYNKYEEGREYPIYCRKKGSLDAKEEILLNVNEMAKGHNYCQISGLSMSKDNNLLVYAEDSVSRKRYTVQEFAFILDLAGIKQ